MAKLVNGMLLYARRRNVLAVPKWDQIFGAGKLISAESRLKNVKSLDYDAGHFESRDERARCVRKTPTVEMAFEQAVSPGDLTVIQDMRPACGLKIYLDMLPDDPVHQLLAEQNAEIDLAFAGVIDGWITGCEVTWVTSLGARGSAVGAKIVRSFSVVTRLGCEPP